MEINTSESIFFAQGGPAFKRKKKKKDGYVAASVVEQYLVLKKQPTTTTAANVHTLDLLTPRNALFCQCTILLQVLGDPQSAQLKHCNNNTEANGPRQPEL